MMLAALHDLTRGPGRALLKATVAIGFSEPVARAGLDAELAAWTEEGFSAVRAELNDDVAPSRVPSTVLVVAASTLPASTLRAVLMARLLGARVLLKPATGQAAIAEAIAAADPAVTVRAFGSTDNANTQPQGVDPNSQARTSPMMKPSRRESGRPLRLSATRKKRSSLRCLP